MFQYIFAALFYLMVILKDVQSGVIYKPYESGKRNVHDDIKFHLYTSRNRDQSYLLFPGDEENYVKSPYNSSNPTIIFSHGFTGAAYKESPQAIKNAYIDNGEFNVILICWERLAVAPWYLQAVRNVAVVGKHTAEFIKWLEYKKAIKISKLHVIGFSLGAHVGAFIGEELARNRSEKIGRLTGLDPASPAFDKLSISSNGLDKDDATFVDVIHTNTRTWGMSTPVGHADFYANYGKSQPGCGTFTLSCSHFRAWQYYAESLSQPCGFPAERCATWKQSPSDCSRSLAYMGIATSPKTQGIYVVTTNSNYPYAKSAVQLPGAINVEPSASSGTDARFSFIDGEESGEFDMSSFCNMQARGDFVVSQKTNPNANPIIDIAFNNIDRPDQRFKTFAFNI